MDFVPEVSAIDTDVIEVDTETRDMLKELGLAKLPGMVIQSAQGPGGRRPRGYDRERR